MLSVGLMRPRNSAYGLALSVAGRVRKNLPNAGTVTLCAAVLNPEGITPGRSNLRSGRPVADVVHLILVDAVSTDRGGVGAARWGKRLPWPRKMGHIPIAGAVPGPVPDRDGGIQNLG